MASVGIPDPVEPQASTPPQTSQTGQRTWQELRQAVKKTRKLGGSLLHRVPNSFTFRHIDTSVGTVTRLYFLGVLPGTRENTLLYQDIYPDNYDGIPADGWTPLLQSFSAAPLLGHFSKEEQLLRERKRMGSLGITSYDYDEQSVRFSFPAASSLYYCTDVAESDAELGSDSVFPYEVKGRCSNPRLDAKLCPANSNLLAYISGNDVWVSNLKTDHCARMTFAHKGKSSLKDDPKSAGVPSFVVQEEFDRYTGYWWQPCLTDTDGRVVYRILYEEVDESEVEILHIVSSTDDSRGYDEYRYPRAGTDNACYDLKILEFEIDESGAISNVVDKRLEEPLQYMFNMEYLLRAGWTPDGKYIYCSLLDRQQHQLKLVLLDLEAFVPSQPAANAGEEEEEEMKSLTTTTTNPARQGVTVIYEDTSDVWVKVHDCLHFFPQSNSNRVSFIWASEKSGYRHLYHVTAQVPGTQTQVLEDSMDVQDEQIDGLSANVIEEIALTQGEWEVCDKPVWVDEDRKLVYFLGLNDTPLETHLYVTSYENPSTVVRLTELGFSHAVSMDKACSMFVSVYSSVSQPPASTVYRIQYSADSISATSCCSLLHPAVSNSVSEEYHPPSLFNFKSSSGHTLHGMYFKPHDYQPGTLYPTVLFVYGGPQVQLVTNSYKALKFLRLHTLAALGYTVVTIDSRGSANRGLEFESAIQRRLGCVEIDDQVEGLQYLSKQVDFIDMSRVAIHGWSYGGYLSLMGLVQRPDVFKVSVAGAPVTTWYLYDTGYTERYMDVPDRNQDGYKNGSVLQYIDSFPEEENRLLIVHGLIDENVHFLHTSTLVNALVKACKPYQLQVYPNERHGIRNPDSSEHYETMVLSFLQKHL